MKSRFAMLLNVLTLLITVTSSLAGDDRKAVEPEYLDMLLRTEQYGEFAELIGIKAVELVRPSKGHNGTRNPMYHKELQFGDFYIPEVDKEEDRQLLKLDENPERKWPNKVVPFTISSEYSANDLGIIRKATEKWNEIVKRVKWNPRKNEEDYVHFFPGKGCHAAAGRKGKQQGLSIAPRGCMMQGVILHEMDHTIGIAHEHNRLDRDNYVRILVDNIPEKWIGQYKKLDPRKFNDVAEYEYYSLMHYNMKAPDTPYPQLPAFEILEDGIDENRIGQVKGFTDTDLKKIDILYSY